MGDFRDELRKENEDITKRAIVTLVFSYPP
jgi:hypothetical protein